MTYTIVLEYTDKSKLQTSLYSLEKFVKDTPIIVVLTPVLEATFVRKDLLQGSFVIRKPRELDRPCDYAHAEIKLSEFYPWNE